MAFIQVLNIFGDSILVVHLFFDQKIGIKQATTFQLSLALTYKMANQYKEKHEV